MNVMSEKYFMLWFSIISIILIIVGFIFSIFGLDILPVIKEQDLVAWTSSIYGAVLIGWGLTLLLVGRYAFIKNDHKLMQYLLVGIFFWLVIELTFSLFLGVYFNVGVDIVVFILFGFPLMATLRKNNNYDFKLN